MALLVVGLILVALGLFSGSVLIAFAFGLIASEPSVPLWVFFPAFSVGGYLIFVVGARTSTIRWISAGVSSFMLTMAVISAIGLVLSAASLIELRVSSALWYVFAVAGALGTFGAATHRKVALGEVARR